MFNIKCIKTLHLAIGLIVILPLACYGNNDNHTTILDSNNTEIVLNNVTIENHNLSTSFYEVDPLNLTNLENDNETETSSSALNINIDDFWDSPNVSSSTASSDEVNIVNFRAIVTTTPGPSIDTNTSTTTTDEPSTASTTTTTTKPTSVSASTLATVRLHSNIVTLKPAITTRVTVSTSVSTTTPKPPTTTLKPKLEKNKFKNKSDTNSVDNANTDESDNEIWKMTLHGTNMNSEELKLCNQTLLAVHFKPYSRRKVARVLKKELDKVFGEYGYRYSVLVSTTSRNTMGKALHGVWLSMSLNGVHYFITATYRVVDGVKLNEADMDKLEYWASMHALTTHNITGYRKYNRIASKLKMDLDQKYGHGNSWSVVIVKNRYLVKAKVFEHPEYHVEFTRLNAGHFIVFRGGQNIEDNARNARMMSMTNKADDEDTSEHSFREYTNVDEGEGTHR